MYVVYPFVVKIYFFIDAVLKVQATNYLSSDIEII
jgi:hypothetical protein